MANQLKYLYAIVDPQNDSVIYIGQTLHPEQRYMEHLRGKLEVDRWMRDMISQGIKPEMRIISKHHKNINQQERYLIAKTKQQNSSLLNKLIPKLV